MSSCVFRESSMSNILKIYCELECLNFIEFVCLDLKKWRSIINLFRVLKQTCPVSCIRIKIDRLRNNLDEKIVKKNGFQRLQKSLQFFGLDIHSFFSKSKIKGSSLNVSQNKNMSCLSFNKGSLLNFINFVFIFLQTFPMCPIKS